MRGGRNIYTTLGGRLGLGLLVIIGLVNRVRVTGNNGLVVRVRVTGNN